MALNLSRRSTLFCDSFRRFSNSHQHYQQNVQNQTNSSVTAKENSTPTAAKMSQLPEWEYTRALSERNGFNHDFRNMTIVIGITTVVGVALFVIAKYDIIKRQREDYLRKKTTQEAAVAETVERAKRENVAT